MKVPRSEKSRKHRLQAPETTGTVRYGEARHHKPVRRRESVPDPIAVYVHVPFCPSKCGYCDFNSYAMSGPIIGRTVDAIEREILASPLAGTPAKTIFFGGGTPTFLEAPDLLRLLHAAQRVHPPITECEITTEANPGTVDAAKFAALRAGGFNRVSLGAQSFLDSDLLRLERVHKADEIGRAVHAAREAGFDNLNLDLMFALPGQHPRAWSANLARALKLEPDHLSLYCLTIEPNTKFYARHLKGQLVLPDEDAQVGMYDEAIRKTTEAGYVQYEISNFCRPGYECRHNLEYWRAEPYAAYGPGAVGASASERTTNLKGPELYCAAVEAGRSPVYEREPLDEETLRLERIMLGLRLNDGLPNVGLNPADLARVLRRGWVHVTEETVRLTPEGRHFCSEVALELA